RSGGQRPGGRPQSCRRGATGKPSRRAAALMPGAARARPAPRRKRFGQHFLHDPAVILRVVRELSPRAGEHLVEIGPGRGALTGELLACEGCTLDAIEIDRDLAALLRERFSPPRCVLHETDALQFDFTALARERGGRLRIAGNLPYNISTPLLFRLLAHAPAIQDLHLLLQREVVARLAAQPGDSDHGRLAGLLAPRLSSQRPVGSGLGGVRPAAR